MRSNLLLSITLLSSLAASSFAALANEQSQVVSLEYKGFYDRLKLVNKGNYPLIEIAFSVPNKTKCQIVSGNISTENSQYPLTYTQQQRLFIPYDVDLKSNRALVNLDIKGDKGDCAIAMQVRARQTEQSYDANTLKQLNNEMNDLLDAMQGFPMKYFREPIAGINFEFGQDTRVEVSLDGKAEQVTGHYRLSVDKLASVTKLSFSAKPRFISPWIM